MQVKEKVCLLPQLLHHLDRISAERNTMKCHLFAIENHILVKSVIYDVPQCDWKLCQKLGYSFTSTKFISSAFLGSLVFHFKFESKDKSIFILGKRNDTKCS